MESKGPFESGNGDSRLLATLGSRVRRSRKERGWTLKELASASRLSARFLSQLEAGDANIAVGRLARVAQALEMPLDRLLVAESTEGPRGAIDRLLAGRPADELARCLRMIELTLGEDRRAAVAFLGLRGAGKSTIGPRVARRLGIPFVELDERIQARAGLGLAEIFSIHGEPYYRRLEGSCLAELLGEGTRRVVELPGGIVRNEDAFDWVLRHSTSVWLTARPEEHMSRVLDQGDTRPVSDRENAMSELREILEARVPQYRRADVTVETSGRTVEATVEETVSALAEHGWEPVSEAEARGSL